MAAEGAHKVTLRHFPMFTSRTFLTLSYRSIHRGHTLWFTACICSKLTAHNGVTKKRCWPHGCTVRKKQWNMYHFDVDVIRFRSDLFIVTHILLRYSAIQMTALNRNACLAQGLCRYFEARNSNNPKAVTNISTKWTWRVYFYVAYKRYRVTAKLFTGSNIQPVNLLLP